MQNEKINAWVTRYALTSGIQLFDGEVRHNISSAMFTYGTFGVAHGKDWHRTPEAALARAEEMRKAKIASLEKSIERIKAIKFTAPHS